jgi:deoxyadenosine/deoxycytidine kinase
MIKEKYCYIHKKIELIEEFTIDKNTKDGFSRMCKKAQSELRAKYSKRIKKYKKEYESENYVKINGKVYNLSTSPENIKWELNRIKMLRKEIDESIKRIEKIE